MNYASIPTKFTYYWAQGASGTYVRQVPMPAQSGGTAGFYTGFPADCFSPVASGGTPPDGRDMNGVLQMLSQWDQWQQLGAPVEWDSTLSTAVSGYPAGAVVQAASGPGAWWLNTVDGNTTNPDASGAGWTAFYPYTGSASKWTTARTVTFSGGAVTGSFSIDGSANVGGVSLAISAGAVGSTQIASAAVTSGALAGGCVGSAALAAGAVTTTAIASGAVTNATLANMAAGTVKANLTGGSAAPSDVTLAALLAALAPMQATANSYGHALIDKASNYGSQWGVASVAGNGGTTVVTLPVAFANACDIVVVTMQGIGSTAGGGWCAYGYSTTGFTIQNNTNTTENFAWIANGH